MIEAVTLILPSHRGGGGGLNWLLFWRFRSRRVEKSSR
jgi:hypothetical protein